MSRQAATQVGNVLELVPELGADDAGDDDHGDDVEGVGVGAVADEIFVEDDGAADSGQPKHQAKGSNVSKTEIHIGIHSDLSIAARRSGAEREPRIGTGFSSRRSEGVGFFRKAIFA